ncbi:MAG: NHL repeat-containing protein [Candidatus Eisenbacteria bacterium]|nr:NHL repeat-containing protein [Candidatus Eisenbacteria bacterium]
MAETLVVDRQMSTREIAAPLAELAPVFEAALHAREQALARLARGTATALFLLGALLAPRPAAAGATILLLDSTHVMGQAHRGQVFVRPRAIALDTLHHEVLVANTGIGRIEFFDYRTWPRGYFTHEVPGPDGRPLAGEPIALAVTPAGEILVSDTKAPYVDVLDYRGRSLQQLVLPAPDDTAGAFRGPGAIAVSPDGRVLVASRGEGRIHVFDRTLRHLDTWGVTGTDSTKLENVTAMAIDSAGRVFIACAATERAVQVFSLDGRYVTGFGRHDLGPGNFSLPSGLAFTTGGRVCVTDAIRQIVQVFESDGTFVGAFGGVGVGLGEFREPSALAGDGHGLLALAEKSGSRFQVMWLR